MNDGISRLSDSASQLASGAKRIYEGSSTLVMNLGSLTDGTTRLEKSTSLIDNGVIELHQGAYQLYQGAHQLHSGTLTFADKLQLLAHASQQLHDGAFSIYTGSQHLHEGTHRLVNGSSRLHDATNQLATGAHRLSHGARELEKGNHSLLQGSQKIADATHRLNKGTQQLSHGSVRLADALQKGVKEIPVYDSHDRNHISSIASLPITTRHEELNAGANGATSSFPLAAILMAWLGAFAAYLLMPALRKRSLQSTRGGLGVTFASLWPALLIMLIHILTIMMIGYVFGIAPEHGLEALIFMLVVGLTFICLHQMFLALFGNRLGRVLSLLFFVIQGASLSGILPIQTAPSVFQHLNNVLPMALGVKGLRHFILGGQTIDSGWVVFGLLIWILVSIILVILSVPHQRMHYFDSLTKKNGHAVTTA